MTEEQDSTPRRVRVQDKRHTAASETPADGGASASPAGVPAGSTGKDVHGPVLLEETSEQEQVPLGEIQEPPPEPELSVAELQRVKADLENARKRMLKEQTRITEYASRRLVEKFLPVLDHFQLALDHGEGGKGIELAIRQAVDVLAGEGLQEVDVPEGTEFDPRLHHAVATYRDPSVAVDTVTKVQRRGYNFKGQFLRSPEVVVAQPADDRAQSPDESEGL
jgi:molecular chaperone GrpE